MLLLHTWTHIHETHLCMVHSSILLKCSRPEQQRAGRGLLPGLALSQQAGFGHGLQYDRGPKSHPARCCQVINAACEAHEIYILDSITRQLKFGAGRGLQASQLTFPCSHASAAI